MSMRKIYKYYKKGRYLKCIELCDNIEFESEVNQFYLNKLLAFSYALSGRYKEAVDLLRWALRIMPNDIECRLLEIYLMIKTGNKKKTLLKSIDILKEIKVPALEMCINSFKLGVSFESTFGAVELSDIVDYKKIKLAFEREKKTRHKNDMKYTDNKKVSIAKNEKREARSRRLIIKMFIAFVLMASFLSVFLMTGIAGRVYNIVIRLFSGEINIHKESFSNDEVKMLFEEFKECVVKGRYNRAIMIYNAIKRDTSITGSDRMRFDTTFALLKPPNYKRLDILPSYDDIVRYADAYIGVAILWRVSVISIINYGDRVRIVVDIRNKSRLKSEGKAILQYRSTNIRRGEMIYIGGRVSGFKNGLPIIDVDIVSRSVVRF